MRILIFGTSGQIGRELGKAAWPAEFFVARLGRAECDLVDIDAVRRAVVAFRPNLVVNAAAYTAVDRAETEPDLAERVNCQAPAAMAGACREMGCALLHLSTDYVFDGNKVGMYREEDFVSPLSVYGRTKADGEAGIRSTLEEHVILRTSWVFSSHGSNFVKTILRLAAQQKPLRVVDDQTGAPTAAGDIAEAITVISNAVASGKPSWGTFHYAGSEPTTWHGFARAILSLSREFKETQVDAITSEAFGAPARRPANSMLDCSRIKGQYGIDAPSWRVGLGKTLAELGH